MQTPESKEAMTVREAADIVQIWAGTDARKNAALRMLTDAAIEAALSKALAKRIAADNDSMNFTSYQELANRTAPMALSAEMKLATFAMGLAGEAGEVVDLLKKHLGHGHLLDNGKLMKELGDVLWYIAAICEMRGILMRDAAWVNIAKLRERYPEGFSSERSQNRKEEP